MKTITEDLEPGAFVPVNAVNGEALRLVMQHLLLTGRVLPVGAHLLVRHDFRSAEEKMLEAIYTFVLPRDAALRRFEVRGEGFAVRSALKPVRQATEEYEKGLSSGHLSTLAKQYRDGLVSLSLGNIRPREEVTVTLEILAGVDLTDDALRFRFPFSLAPSYHAQAKAAETGRREGEIELPSDLFGDLILPPFRASADGLHEVAFDLQLEMPWEVEEVASPSHPVRICKSNRVTLAPGADLPDRDLVLDIRTKAQTTRVLAGTVEDGRMHFAAVIPSREFGTEGESPRTLVLLLDRSGSMSGTPIDRVRKAAAACLAALRPDDRFGLVAFDDTCELLSAELLRATPESRLAARSFLDRIDARGGTELAAGIRQAAGLLRESGGDVFVLTDGQVFGTEDILETARATGCRLHALGIGSASQDRFLALLARETGGISRFVTPRERVDQAVLELFASAGCPLATDLRLAGVDPADTTVSPDPPGTVFAGTPVLLFGDCAAGASGSMVFEFSSSGKPSSRRLTLDGAVGACGETLRLIRGSRLITDAEARLGAGTGREDTRWEEYITRLSGLYSLASRTMALVAVVERAGDRPGEPPKTKVVPVGLPQDMDFSGVFGSARSASTLLCASLAVDYEARGPASWMPQIGGASLEGDSDEYSAVGYSYRLEENGPASRTASTESVPPAEEASDFDLLMDLAARLLPDGGMPGRDSVERILTTLLTILALTAQGHDLRSGAFRVHVRRMLEYLEHALPGTLTSDKLSSVHGAIEWVKRGRVLPGDWLSMAADLIEARSGTADRAWSALKHA